MNLLLWLSCVAGLSPEAPAHMTFDLPPGAAAREADLAGRLEEAYTSSAQTGAEGRPRYVNRLILEDSPYLRRHAHNPVDWFPWGEEAFAEAERRAVPVLLSVGYSTCHWCHVLEAESFEDLEIARFINEHYVAVKVDREQRPDIDAIYMAAAMAMGGGGGWPLTVWLTPEREPFYAATYLPARDGDRGVQTGFLTLLTRMSTAYQSDPQRALEAGRDLARHLAESMAATASQPEGPPGAEVLDEVRRKYVERYDPDYGGLQGQQKFPSALPIRFLLDESRRTGDHSLLEMARRTLTQMASGAILDPVGSGLHRYTTDARWQSPHYEKMLYDNALVAIDYAEASVVLHDEDLGRVAREILAFLDREMSLPNGAFAAALDSQSLAPEGVLEEGRFYTWTEEEIREVLDEDTETVALAWLALPEGGARGPLYTRRSLPQVAEALGQPVEATRARIGEVKAALLRAREKRAPPARDDTAIVAWNGLAISAYARVALLFGDRALAARARRAADAVLAGATRAEPDGTLHVSRSISRDPQPGVLEDHAALCAALIDLFEASTDVRYLTAAIALDQTIESRFEDPSGAWFRAPEGGEALIARERPSSDGAEPSGSSLHARSLYRLAALTGDDRYRARAERGLSALRARIARGSMPEMLHAVGLRVDPPREITIVTPPSAEPFELARPLTEVVAREAPVHRVLVVAPSDQIPAIARFAPMIEGKEVLGSRPTATVCHRGLCSPPTSDPAALRALLAPPNSPGDRHLPSPR